MYLKSLEISGFKSFGRKGSLEFKTPISAIVGPNGSGKSNVAESFRFVLGEQSMKTLRGKRGEDLIFSGSREERPMNRASVKVVFDNTTRFLDIDYDEVSIERVVHRDGVNQYFINKSQVRLKDISELLAGANIGASGHHIISQGEADRILSVNSKERRGIIEEALGLRVYQFKILESERKLGKVDENIKSVQSLRREIAPHLKFLKKQVSRLEESLELKEQLRKLYKDYFKREDIYLKHWRNHILQNKKPLEAELESMNAELSDAKKILSDVKNNDKEDDVLLGFENKLKEVRAEKSELDRKIGQIEGMISFEERRIKQDEERQKREESRVVRFSEVKSVLNEIEALFDKYQGVDLLKKVKEVISGFVTKNTNFDNNVETDKKELPGLLEKKNGFIKEKEVVLEKERGLLSEYNNRKGELEKEKDSLRKAELRIFEINAKQSDVRSKLNALVDLEDRINIESENYKKELSEGFILAGPEATRFSDYDLAVSDSDIISEKRFVQEDRRRDIEKIKIKLESMGAGSGDDVVKEYNETKERDEFLEREIGDLQNSEQSLKQLIAELKEKLDTEFKEGVEKINKQFNEFFALMFGGGSASLSVVKAEKRKKKDDELLPEFDEEAGEDGIDVNVSLPNKKTKGLQMLSGGERSLTSIALLFAMSQIKPPPFIILDETDAALDEANSRRYGDMIENLSKYSQLILITHNRETMSRAGVLYGVTMGGDGVSRLLSIELEEAVKVAK